MRFINATTLQFVHVPDSELAFEENKYAVLSHRWGAASDEISFQDIEESRDYLHKKGFAKFKGFCDLAFESGCRYCWIDTCCINKGDAMEMNEAINSMYRWYEESHICIIYLEDVPQKPLFDSVWFDRGWTLQELIAPKEANFYDKAWQFIGSKTGLSQSLSTKTAIPESILNHTMKPSACSVAQRMSWAAKRQTTRVEDRAYSLLGIFAINMPQIYGEREAAFLRLQRAVIQQSKDETIFAWPINDEACTGLLAKSPSDFAGCNDVISIRGSTGFSESNGELSIKLRVIPYSMETYCALLHCTDQTSTDARIAIFLTKLSGSGEYVRVKKAKSGGQVMMSSSSINSLTDRLFRVSLIPTERPLNIIYGFHVRTIEPPGHEVCHPRILSKCETTEDSYTLLEDGHTGTAGIVYMEGPNHFFNWNSSVAWSKIRWLKFGFDDDFNPTIFVGNGMRDYLYDRGTPTCKPTSEQVDEMMLRSKAEPTAETRRNLFSNDWISSKGWVPSRSYGWQRGVSILKVNRETGISGCLGALNLGISVKLLPTSISSPSVEEWPGKPAFDSSETYIWTIDLTEVAVGDPEAELRAFETEESKGETLTAFCLCCFGQGCDDGRIEQRDERNRRAMAQTKILGVEDLT
ncbi:MAG: hypothetical protein Q9174_004223 [Haloplaca sp. 1 TL-2023]